MVTLLSDIVSEEKKIQLKTSANGCIVVRRHQVYVLSKRMHTFCDYRRIDCENVLLFENNYEQVSQVLHTEIDFNINIPKVNSLSASIKYFV